MAQIELSGELVNTSSSTPLVRVKDVWDDSDTTLTDLLNQKSSGGVTSLNTKTGAVTIAAGTNVTIDNTTAGTITISASGSGSGTNGNSTEIRYAISTTTTAPAIDRTARTPSGWSTTYDSVPSGSFLFRTEAVISGSDSTKLVGSWSIPVRVNPEDGKAGRSITAINKYFYDSDSMTIDKTVTWKTAPSCNLNYIWVKTEYVYSSGDPTYTYEVCKNGEDGTGESAVKLDLSNENPEINADSSWNILSGATRPICTATLKYGTATVTDAKYSISTPSDAAVKGLSIAPSTGVLTFNAGTATTPFSFTGTSLSITVSASGTVTGVGTVSGEKVMTVTKVIPGANGEPATSYWLVMSADSIKITADNVATPSTITASAMKQVGENTPVAATDATIYYGYDGASSTVYSSAVTVDKTKDYLTFVLKVNGVQRVLETVPILKDGNSLQGAIIRGPRNWSDVVGTTQYFQDGDTENGRKFLDVVIYNDVYYYCNKYYQHTKDTAFESANWTAGESFDFIATKVLLAKNAKINFLSGNEITLTDADGNVSAGARAATSDNQVVFWAGGNTTSLTSNPFYVLKDGTIKATKGTIGGIHLSENGIYSTGETFKFNADGSGSLANGQITWTSAGALTISNYVTANTLEVTKEAILNSVEAKKLKITTNSGMDITIDPDNGFVMTGSDGALLYIDIDSDGSPTMYMKNSSGESFYLNPTVWLSMSGPTSYTAVYCSKASNDLTPSNITTIYKGNNNKYYTSTSSSSVISSGTYYVCEYAPAIPTWGDTTLYYNTSSGLVDVSTQGVSYSYAVLVWKKLVVSAGVVTETTNGTMSILAWKHNNHNLVLIPNVFTISNSSQPYYFSGVNSTYSYLSGDAAFQTNITTSTAEAGVADFKINNVTSSGTVATLVYYGTSGSLLTGKNITVNSAGQLYITG